MRGLRFCIAWRFRPGRRGLAANFRRRLDRRRPWFHRWQYRLRFGCRARRRRDGRRLRLFLQPAQVAHGKKEVGDAEITLVDSQVDCCHSPLVGRRYIRSRGNAGLHGGHAVAVNGFEQVAGSRRRINRRRLLCPGVAGRQDHDRHDQAGRQPSSKSPFRLRRFFGTRQTGVEI